MLSTLPRTAHKMNTAISDAIIFRAEVRMRKGHRCETT